MRKKTKIGFLTIGQAPRDDVLSDLLPLLPPELDIIQAGALDELKPGEIALLSPAASDFPLITRLQDGNTAVVCRKKILPLLQAKIIQLEAKGAEIISLLCTEDFPEIKSSRILLQPFAIMMQEIESQPIVSKIMVFVPLAAQKVYAQQKWPKPSSEILPSVLNPYESMQNIEPITAFISQIKPDLLLFDCIGYSLSLAKAISSQLSVPMLVPRLVLAQAIIRLL